MIGHEQEVTTDSHCTVKGCQQRSDQSNLSVKVFSIDIALQIKRWEGSNMKATGLHGCHVSQVVGRRAACHHKSFNKTYVAIASNLQLQKMLLANILRAICFAYCAAKVP
jgi:hypothetical protein